MEKNFCRRDEQMKNAGDFEFGNIDLSYSYCKRYFKKTSCNSRSFKLLDIGTNRGTLIWKLYQSGSCRNVYGIDLREEGILSGKKEYTKIQDRLFYHADSRHLPFEDDSFDVVCMFDVMEHIPDIRQYLKTEIRRILKPGGSLIFQTPNKPMNIMFEMIRNKSFTKYREYHCSLQTVASLRKMLQASGFEEIVIEKYSLYSAFNKKKVRKYFGIFGPVIMKICSRLPLVLYPNLWGHAINRKK